MSSELEDRLREMSDRVPDPPINATIRAREAALNAVVAPQPRSRARRAVRSARRSARVVMAVAGVVAIGAFFAALIIATPTDSPKTDDGESNASLPTREDLAAARLPGIAAAIVFRPVAGVSEDAAFVQMDRVIQARARERGLRAKVVRSSAGSALVTLTGTRDRVNLGDVIAGSSVAVYDLDDTLVGSFSSLRRAVLRARELAPDAPGQVAYLFRNGHRVRGPAPAEDDLRRLTRTLPAGSEILSVPEGYAILRRQTAPDAQGAPKALGSPQFFVVRDEPVVSPLEVTGAAWPESTGPPDGSTSVPVGLTDAGRRAWDELLVTVSARAASLGRPQRIALTTNGDVWQMTVADPSGQLDTRPGSPALEFGGGVYGSSGTDLTTPNASDLPSNGSIPAVVWIAETYRVGPLPEVYGEKVEPLPENVQALIARGEKDIDLSTLRRSLVADGPDGQWSVWSYLLTTGMHRSLILGPRPTEDDRGFSCLRMQEIRDCTAGGRYQLVAVPPGARTLRLTPRSGPASEAPASNGWAMLFEPGGGDVTPQGGVTAEALDENGRILATRAARFVLP
jgi:hypothetical protein